MSRATRSPIAVVAAVLLAASTAAADADAWRRSGREAVDRARTLARAVADDGAGPAKNVILFVGDGMGPTTVAAARILEGQQRGGTGEENLLSFERFPHTALQQDLQHRPADAGLGRHHERDDERREDPRWRHRSGWSRALRRLRSVAGSREIAQPAAARGSRGLATGVVTTTRITHATPAATYAHTPHRDWEADALVPAGRSRRLSRYRAPAGRVRSRRRHRGGDGRRPADVPAARRRATRSSPSCPVCARTAAISWRSGARAIPRASTRGIARAFGDRLRRADKVFALFQPSATCSTRHDRAAIAAASPASPRWCRPRRSPAAAQRGGLPAGGRGRPHRPRPPRQQRLPRADRHHRPVRTPWRRAARDSSMRRTR
jgi:hypothetical protein